MGTHPGDPVVDGSIEKDFEGGFQDLGRLALRHVVLSCELGYNFGFIHGSSIRV
jgi:hypothetical protein